ncbi:MAG: hypothetical protein AB7W16_12250 [Candidatus Obscuribacterales bacterium]
MPKKLLHWLLIVAATVMLPFTFLDPMVTGRMTDQERELEMKKRALEARMKIDSEKPAAFEKPTVEARSKTSGPGIILFWLVLATTPATLWVFRKEINDFYKKDRPLALIGAIAAFVALLLGLLIGI